MMEKSREKLATVQLLSLDQELVVNSSQDHVVIQYVRHHRKGNMRRRSCDQHEPFGSSNHLDVHNNIVASDWSSNPRYF